MPGVGGELSVETHVHPVNGWILVPVEVGGMVVNMVLDSGAPLSAISSDVRALLEAAGRLQALGPNRYLLRGATIEGQLVPELALRISRRVTEVGAGGVLGLDFLRRFTDIHFHVPTLRLTLVDP